MRPVLGVRLQAFLLLAAPPASVSPPDHHCCVSFCISVFFYVFIDKCIFHFGFANLNSFEPGSSLSSSFNVEHPLNHCCHLQTLDDGGDDDDDDDDDGKMVMMVMMVMMTMVMMMIVIMMIYNAYLG